jgi:hypothetical protein
MARLQARDLAGMWADIRTTRKLARLVGQGMTLVDRLVAGAIDRQACEAVIVAARDARLTAEAAKAALAEAAAFPPLPDVADSVDQYERLYGLEAIQLMARAQQERNLAAALLDFAQILKPITWPPQQSMPLPPELAGAPPNPTIDWDVALKAANAAYDRVVAAMREKADALRHQESEALKAEMGQAHKDFGDRLITPGGVKKLLDDLAAANPQELANLARQLGGSVGQSAAAGLLFASSMQDARSAVRQLSAAALALAAYKAEKGAYPAKLADLVPTYLKVVPEDLFAGGSLTYKRVGDGYSLYSVGENMADDGGEEDGEADDIVVRVGE